MIDSAKVQKISDAAKYQSSIWAHFGHQFSRFLRAVISRPDCRNFRADEITFRAQRATWRQEGAPRRPASQRPIKVIQEQPLKIKELLYIKIYNNLITTITPHSSYLPPP